MFQKLTPKRIARRLRTAGWPLRELWREGNAAKAAVAFLLTLLWCRWPLTVRIRGRPVTIRLLTPDLAVAKECFGGELDSAIAAAKPAQYGLIVDAGGYIGTAAIMLAQAFPTARVVTLEPSRENFAILQQNIVGFPNIIAVNKALGTVTGTTSLVNCRTGEWGYSTVQNPAHCRSPLPLHDVDVTTLPELLEEYQAEGIDLLKLDIEGAEYELLNQSAQWIDKTRVVIAELHPTIVPGVSAAFARATNGRAAPVQAGEKVISVRATSAVAQR